MITTILFDMDGVLVDSEPLAIKRSIKALTHLGLPYDIDMIKTCIGTSMERTFEILEEMINGPLPENYEALEEELMPHDTIDYNLHKMPGLDELIRYCRDNKFKTALCSSSPINRIYDILNSLNLTEFFDVVISGESFTHTKPHPEIYLEAMKQLGVSKEECLIIEDSYHGILSGKNAGVTTIAFRNLFYEVDTSLADYVVDDLTEVIQLIESLKK